MEPCGIYENVNRRYGSVIRSSTGEYEKAVAKAFGYTEEELAAIPEGANLGLSCGNPTALANLREVTCFAPTLCQRTDSVQGETVIDLGSGAGFDIFTAANKIGPAGRAIGIDMNEVASLEAPRSHKMIDRANANAERAGFKNVEFVQSPITTMPLPDGIADCIISNCVINLVPAEEKRHVFNEIYRLLKPGGRVAISDILARKEFTKDIRESAALYVGCIAGASLVADYDGFLRDAGFSGRSPPASIYDALILDGNSDLNVYFTLTDENTACCSVDKGVGGKTDIMCVTKEEDSDRAAEPSACGEQSKSHLTPGEAKEQADLLGMTDLNEWAGKYIKSLIINALFSNYSPGSFRIYAFKS
ncbi:putative arsenite methyltransferase [Colletotrichum chlorophyti]|uniref:Arsenite methyltransferase n=1 Tax=Colletotrichum chlorophyti TaxID=708187 RepID=A0A1Q8RSD3_9PEZI|nr:putative arsenite methyltransferase [Colletotrichum chlorophyti]